MEAIYRLAWLTRATALVPVNWRDMETEELGSVYESLLELTPRLTDDGRGFAFARRRARPRATQRKTTGSYYTPDSLVQALLDSALDPVLDRVEAEADDPAEALLGVTVIDPACGSGHFLLAAARRIATRLARARAGGAASAGDYRHALRDVARALHPRRRPQPDGGRADQGRAVDRDGRARQAARLPRRQHPLRRRAARRVRPRGAGKGHSRRRLQAARRRRQGDRQALLAAQQAPSARARAALDFAGGGGRLPPAAPLAQRRTRAARPAGGQSRGDRREARALRGRARRPARLVAAHRLPTSTSRLPRAEDRRRAGDDRNDGDDPDHRATSGTRSPGAPVYGPLRRPRAATSPARRAPSIGRWNFRTSMAAGGFDVVLGNPPWERIKLQEQEFFAARDPEIAEAPNAAARGRLIAKLKEAAPGTRERALYEEFEAAKRVAEAVVRLRPRSSRGRRPFPAHRTWRRQHLRAVCRAVR